MFDKFLFLDIDGVLNCRRSNTFYNPDSPETYSIDEHLWGNLEMFLSMFKNVGVVIHSGWTKHIDNPDYEWDMGVPEKGVKIKSLLHEVIRRLGDRYIGCTPYIKGKPKHDRILKWLDDNKFFDSGTTQCLILDDDDSEYSNIAELESFDGVYVHFIDRETGFDDRQLDEVSEIAGIIFS